MFAVGNAEADAGLSGSRAGGRGSGGVFLHVMDDIADAGRRISNMDFAVGLPFFCVLFFLGLLLSFLGHKLKKCVLFIVGALLPVFFYRLKMSVDPVTKMIGMLILSVIGGCFFVAYPKRGLAGVGIVGGAVLGRLFFAAVGHQVVSWVCASFCDDGGVNRREEIWTQYHDLLDVAVILVFCAIGGLLVAGCFSNLYCLVVPFVGAVLAADAGVHVWILCVFKWIPRFRELFPIDTPLALGPRPAEATASGGGSPVTPVCRPSVSALLSECVAGSASAAEELHSWGHGSVAVFWAPWLCWFVVFLLCFTTGVHLQCTEYHREKRKKEKVPVWISDDEAAEKAQLMPKQRGAQLV